jgi:hypothetical protein
MTYDEAKKFMGISIVDDETVRSQYRKLVFKHHPDHGGSVASFQQLTRAYEMLLKASKIVAPTDSVSESSFVSRMKTELEKVGAVVLKVHGGPYQQSGWPDLQVYHTKWTGHLEAKVGNNPASSIQKEVIIKLRKRGTPAGVIRLRNGVVTMDGCESQLKWPCDGETLLSWVLYNCNELLRQC